MFLRSIFGSYYPALILLLINSISISNISLFHLWWYLVSDLLLSLSQLVSPLLHLLCPVQLQREVTERLWLVPGVQLELNHCSNFPISLNVKFWKRSNIHEMRCWTSFYPSGNDTAE